MEQGQRYWVLQIAIVNSAVYKLYPTFFFKKVYSTTESKIELVQHKEPKEITCRGGLHSDADLDIENIKSVLIGNIDNTLIPENKITYENLTDEAILKSVIAEVSNFLDLLFNVNNEFNFSAKFGVNPAHLDEIIKIFFLCTYESRKNDTSKKDFYYFHRPCN